MAAVDGGGAAALALALALCGAGKAQQPLPPVSSPFGGAPTVQLRDGFFMPLLGYGTCCRKTARGEVLENSTLAYLRAGGRLVDTAMAYRNHAEIGRALTASALPRAAVWITSKISPNKVGTKDEAVAATRAILQELGVAYLDLLLIHSPKLGRAKTVDLWRGLVSARDLGLVRSIGVSNFNWDEIAALQEETGVLPVVNQIQLHPWTPKEWKDTAAKQKAHGVATTAFTSLGGSRFTAAGRHYGPVVEGIATKHGVTAAQVLLRWALQQGVAAIPGSATPEHIRENLLAGPAAGLVLDAAELAGIAAAPAPEAWFDPRRGPFKMAGELALAPWAKKDRTGKTSKRDRKGRRGKRESKDGRQRRRRRKDELA